MPIILLLLFSFALSIGTGIVVLVIRRAGKRTEVPPAFEPCQPGPDADGAARPSFLQRPGSWLAVRSRNLMAVKKAIGLHNVKRCPWYQGLAGEEKLFISPPIGGWILVVGSGLPDPADDVDVAFRFLVELSRKLGQVQFFSASSILNYHAWVKAERGKVVRAYAWAGKTLWKQGTRTRAERDLGVQCFDYSEAVEENGLGRSEALSLNVEKVPLLAARWSLDPAKIDGRRLETECGLAGEPSHIY